MPGISRRRLFVDVATGSLAAVSFVGRAPAETPAVPKQSQEDALYQNKPKNGQVCGICAFFQPPGDCTRVDGNISPTGWCKNFQLRK
jgi:hypothetical protein